MCRTWGLNSGPLACQANSLPIEQPHTEIWCDKCGKYVKLNKCNKSSDKYRRPHPASMCACHRYGVQAHCSKLGVLYPGVSASLCLISTIIMITFEGEVYIDESLFGRKYIGSCTNKSNQKQQSRYNNTLFLIYRKRRTGTKLLLLCRQKLPARCSTLHLSPLCWVRRWLAWKDL